MATLKSNLNTLKHIFILWLIVLLGCNKAEMDSFQKITNSFNTAQATSNSDYQIHFNNIEMALSLARNFLNEYPNSEHKGTIDGYISSLQNRKSYLLSEKEAYDALVARRKSFLNFDDANSEIREIWHFLNQFESSFKNETLRERLESVSVLRRDLFLKDFDTQLEQLNSKMKDAAESVAQTAHPISRPIDIEKINEEDIPKTPIGTSQISNRYKIIMRAFVSQFELIIDVTGEISGDLSSGIQTRVVSTNLLLDQRLQ